MRPQAQINMGYVPTPAIVVERVRAMLNIPHDCPALDPCCGFGEALADLAPEAVRYGVELDPQRGHAAQERLHHVIVGDGNQCRISHNSFGLLLLNPPYDDSTEGRLEKVFLERHTPYLAIGGVLVLIIPAGRYCHVQKYLRRRYDVIGHWRFPDGWYEGPELSYRQTVLIAKRRLELASPVGLEFWRKTLRLPEDRMYSPGPVPADALDPLPDTIEGEPVDVPRGKAISLFSSGMPGPEEVAQLLAKSPVPRLMSLPPQVSGGRPPLPLRQGHIALTLASGLMDGVFGSGAKRHITKGMVTRFVTTEAETVSVNDSGEQLAKETKVEGFTVSVRALTVDGTIHTMEGSKP